MEMFYNILKAFFNLQLLIVYYFFIILILYNLLDHYQHILAYL